MKTRSRVLLLAIVFLIPLVIRLGYLLDAKELIVFYKGGAEATFFQEWATARKALGWHDTAPPFREPLYPYFIGLIRIVAQNLNAIRLAQIFLSSLVSVFIFLIGERLYGKTAGIIASILFAFYSPSIFSSGAVNEATLATFLLILSFYLLLRQTSPGNAFFSGIVLGLGFLSRFIVGIALIPWIFHFFTQGKSVARRTVLPLIVGSLMPIVIYQTLLLRSSDRCLFPTRMGWQVFLASQGNTNPGDFLPAKIKIQGSNLTVNVASDLLMGQADARRLARLETATDIKQAKLNSYWIRRALESPKQVALSAYIRRLGFLFAPLAPPSEFDLRFVSDYVPILRIGIWLVPLVIPLGLMGIAFNRKVDKACIASFVILYALISPVLILSDIDKLPLVAILTLPAGAFLVEVYNRFSKASIKPIRAVATVAVLAILLSLVGPKLDKANQLVLLGNLYREAFIADEAKKTYEKALLENPMCAEAYIGLSRLYVTQKDPSGAFEVLEDATSKGVNDPRVMMEKVFSLLALGEKQKAKDLAFSLAEAYPLLPHLNEILGSLLLEMGETGKGIAYLEKEVEYGIPSSMTHAFLGRAYLQMEDYERAASHLENAIRVRIPGVPVLSWIMMLADAYTGMGYHLKACNLLYQVAKEDVANISVGLKFADCLSNAGRYKDALMELKHLRRFEPTNTDILLRMGETYVQLDSLDQAHLVWQEVLKIDPENTAAKERIKELRK